MVHIHGGDSTRKSHDKRPLEVIYKYVDDISGIATLGKLKVVMEASIKPTST